MKFREYSIKAKETAAYPTDGFLGLSYTALGLNGESGEVAEKVKKLIRDGGSRDIESLIAEHRWEIAKELGDVLWYLSALCNELGVSLEEVASLNVEKLRSRQLRGVLGGSGDSR